MGIQFPHSDRGKDWLFNLDRHSAFAAKFCHWVP